MLKRIAAGAVGGCVATVPMTIAMKLWPLVAPRAARYPLPPREVAMRAARRAGVEPRDEDDRTAVTYATHFGVGTTAGAVYGATMLGLPVPPVVSGMAFGLGVWTASYLGVLPELRIIPESRRRPAAWHALLAVSHIVWGATTGVVASRLAKENRATGDAASSDGAPSDHLA